MMAVAIISVIKADTEVLFNEVPGNAFYISHSVEPVPTSLGECS